MLLTLLKTSTKQDYDDGFGEFVPWESVLGDAGRCGIDSAEELVLHLEYLRNSGKVELDRIPVPNGPILRIKLLPEK